MNSHSQLFPQGLKTVTAAGTPERIVARTAPTTYKAVIFHARKAQGTANTGEVYLGQTAAAGSQRLVLSIGEKITLTADEGKRIDLSTFWIDAATSGDGVQWTAR